MQIISKIFNSLLSPLFFKGQVYVAGPNNLEDLLKQFDTPKKEKTPLQIFQDYYYKESMSKLEVEMLKLEPIKVFKGVQLWSELDGTKFFDWVPCSVRPEVIYCCYGKN
jgi:hypothetical protein